MSCDASLISVEGEIEKFEIIQKFWDMPVKDLVSMLQLRKTDMKKQTNILKFSNILFEV